MTLKSSISTKTPSDRQSSSKSTRRAVLTGSASLITSSLLPHRLRAQTQPDKISIAMAAGNLTPVLEEIMRQQGFLTRFGLSSEPLYVSDGTKIMGSILAGEIDLCPMAGFAQVFPAVEKGAHLKIVNGGVLLGQQTVFSANPAVKSISDLKGKTIGVGSLGAQLHQVMVALLIKNGVDPADVTFANIGSSPDVFRAVAAKVIDAGPAQIDFLPQLDRTNVHVVQGGDMWTNLPEYPFQGGFTSDRMIKDKRELLVRALSAYALVFRFVSSPDSLDSFKEARRKVLNGKDADFDAASEFQWRFFQTAKPLATDLIISDERLNYVQDLHLRFNVQQKKLMLDDVADMSLARDAIARLG